MICFSIGGAPQAVIFEMESFLKIAKPREREVLQRYVDRCLFLHGSVTIVNYLTTSFVICAPLFLPDEEFPTPAVYPFPVDSGIAMYLVYVHQSFVGFQCSVGATVDCQAALLTWYVGARLEILSHDANDIRDASSLRNFIRKHQQLLE